MTDFDKLLEKELKRIDKRIATLKEKSFYYGSKYDNEIDALNKEKRILQSLATDDEKSKIIKKIKEMERSFHIGSSAANELIDFIENLQVLRK
mgnify:FL=1